MRYEDMRQKEQNEDFIQHRAWEIVVAGSSHVANGKEKLLVQFAFQLREQLKKEQEKNPPPPIVPGVF